MIINVNRLKEIGKKYAPLTAMLVFPFLGIFYDWVNKVGDGDTVYHLTTPFDDAIPYIKFFALPYAVWIVYIYICLFYFFKKDVKTFYRAVAAYTLCALICYLIYSVFQTTVPRPFLDGDDPFTHLVAYIYDHDLPYNCFPSIHCFSSYMVFRLLFGSEFRNKRNTLLIGAVSAIIVLSTLFIKQHAILDVLGAFLLVEIVLPIVILLERWLLRSTKAETRQRQRQRQNGTYGA